MSATEAEVHEQVEESREALQTIKTSLRMGSMVRLLGTVVGILIVCGYLYLFWSLAKQVRESPQIREAFVEYVDRLRIGDKTTEVAQGIAPVYLEEIRGVLEETGFQEAATDELTRFVEDARPIVAQEMERIRPEVVASIEAQADKTYRRLETDLRARIEQKLEDIVRGQLETLEEDADISEERFAEILEGLATANREALQNVVGKRWNRNNERLHRIHDLIAQLPPAPDLSQQELQDEIVLCLVALLKGHLPEYEFTSRTQIPPFSYE